MENNVMKRLPAAAPMILGALALLLPARPLAAQGVTSAAVTGRLIDETGAAVSGAVVALTNSSNGRRYEARSADDGRYFFENVDVGGPYALSVRGVGFEPVSASNITLNLGQRLVQDFTLKHAAVEVTGVTVTAEQNPLLSPSRTGPQTFVSESALANLPNLTRDFTTLVGTAPQAVGTSIGNQNNRFNNIQIDGSVNNDLFGLASNGLPGGQANAHAISIEAVREFQVMIAPFDVRQGGFTGGLVNAVTKSGTNEFHGTAFGYLANQNLEGKDTSGAKAADFSRDQYGFSLGGPIMRDKLHFFTAVELQSRAAPWGGQQIGSDTAGGADSAGVGIRQATVDTVQKVLQSVYGISAGTWTAPTLDNPDHDIFAKLDYELGTNSQVELSGNFVSANNDVLIRNSTATGFRDGYQLTNSGYKFSSSISTERAKWNAVLGGKYTNELIVSHQDISDHRNIPNRVPLIFVAGDRAGTNIAAGAERFSHANTLDQGINELTDNLTFARGAHLITVGTHNEFFHFKNVFFPASLGVWSFQSVDSLTNGLASRYEIALPGALRPDGPVADFNVQQVGFYLGDQWTVTPKLTLTPGLRVDIPFMKKPAFNQQLDTTTGLAINTAQSPSGGLLLSPRVGFSYDVTGDRSTFVRGGVGIFSGRPPYVWVSNAYTNTGLEQATLTCTGAGNVPTFTANPDSQPKQCAGGGGASTPIPTINFFDKGFKFPQDMKVALGADQLLPWNVVGTFDFLYTRTLNQFYLTDVNLKGIQGSEAGEGGRPLYGAFSAGSWRAARISPAFFQAIEHMNKSTDRSYSLTWQLQKRFSNGVEFDAAYTYSNTKDLFSLTSSIASSNLGFEPLDGTLANRTLTTSAFDVPHNIKISGTANIKWGITASLFYIGQSGSPFTYVVSNDANGDGLSNDIVYIPRDSTDITLANPSQWGLLNGFINKQSCLNNQRGSLQRRNTCRNPFTNFINARLSKTVPTVGGQSFDITLDIINLPHLLSSKWGLIRQTTGFDDQSMLRVAGFDAVNQRSVYTLSLPSLNRIQVNSSRWIMQGGIRYSF
ncbi:MAG TPA: TonB-dependent receptor [Gemmatimonadales bacterium]|nr:TonB-dependent receptor [Gemmatimonadales bacterium]